MLIGLSGPARVGKDTVAKILVERHGFRRVAFADKMKDALYALNPWITPRSNDRELEHLFDAFPSGRWELQQVVDKVGWDVAKQLPEVRGLLQRLGTELGRNVLGADIWVMAAFPPGEWWMGQQHIVVSDVRFDNEAKFIRENGGFVVHLSRVGVGPVNSHVSEAGVEKDPMDFEIHNSVDEIGYWTGAITAALGSMHQILNERRQGAFVVSERPMAKAYERQYLR